MTIPSWCYRGAKVVCVDATNNPGFKWYAGECPCVGAVYTVSDAFVDPDGTTCITLEELHRTPEALAYWGYTVGYSLTRFRPLVSLEDDLEAHFNQFLTTDHRERV